MIEQYGPYIVSFFIGILSVAINRFSLRRIHIRFSNILLIGNYNCPKSDELESLLLVFKIHIINNKHFATNLFDIKMNYYSLSDKDDDFQSNLYKVKILKDKFGPEVKILDEITELNVIAKSTKTVTLGLVIEEPMLLDRFESITFSYRIGSGKTKEIKSKDVNFLNFIYRKKWNFNEKYISKYNQVVLSSCTSKHYEKLLKDLGLLDI